MEKIKFKKCTKCKTTKPYKSFSKNKSKSDGLQSLCKVCKNILDKLYYKNNKQKFLSYNKSRKDKIKEIINSAKSYCKICGENHIATLDFHHNDPTEKEINISKIVLQGWSDRRIKTELDKCIVLCSNCHRKLHWKENNEKNE